MYTKLIIYFFSGTGNAKNVAYWFAEKAKEKGIDTEVRDISKTDRKNIPSSPEGALIGFVSPTHGFNLPPIMLNFLARFPRSDNNQAFVINTRAGLKLHKLFVPGLSGIALLYALFVLFLKKYKVVGLRSVDLPSNWISLHPGVKQKIAVSIREHCKIITEQFAEKILSGKRNYRAFFDIIQDLLISPIAIGYYIAGRFFLAKTFYASSKCNNCNLCINSCPVKAIKEVDKRPFWTYKCESCMKCMNICPERAIQTGHGFTALLLYLIFGLGINFIFNYFSLDEHPFMKNDLTSLTVKTIIFMPFLFIGYRVVHYLLRYKFFETLINITSLTWYHFWRRYKGLKQK